jgi:hypothetical protein
MIWILQTQTNAANPITHSDRVRGVRLCIMVTLASDLGLSSGNRTVFFESDRRSAAIVRVLSFLREKEATCPGDEGPRHETARLRCRIGTVAVHGHCGEARRHPRYYRSGGYDRNNFLPKKIWLSLLAACNLGGEMFCLYTYPSTTHYTHLACHILLRHPACRGQQKRQRQKRETVRLQNACFSGPPNTLIWAYIFFAPSPPEKGPHAPVIENRDRRYEDDATDYSTRAKQILA